MADQSTQQSAHAPSSSSSRYDKQKQDRGPEAGATGSSNGGETRRKGKEREKANQEETKGSLSSATPTQSSSRTVISARQSTTEERDGGRERGELRSDSHSGS